MKRLKVILYSFFCLLGFLTLNGVTHAQPPKGPIFDLKNWGPNSETSFSLNGQWYFVWNKLINPNHFTKDPTIPPEAFKVSIPGRWIEFKTKEKITALGKGTYIGIIDNIPHDRPLLFKIIQAYTAFKVYFIQNGNIRDVWENGRLESSSEKEIPGNYYSLKNVQFSKGRVFLIIHISNHLVHSGGLLKSIDIGSENNIFKQDKKRNFVSISVFGIMLIMGIYHFIFFSMRKKDKSLLWFGLFCLIAAMRTAVVEYFIERSFQQTTQIFSWNYRLNFLSIYLLLPIFVTFLRHVFPKVIPSFIEKSLWPIIIFYSLSLFLPPHYFSNLTFQRTFQLIIVIYGLALTVIIGKAYYQKVPLAGVVFWSIVIVLSTAIYDILANIYHFPVKDIVTWGFLFFVMAQSYLLAKKFAQTFNTIERLKENLEKDVKRRTIDLELQAIELEDLMEKIYDQKKAREDLLSHIGDAYMVFDKRGIIQDGSNHTSEILFKTNLFESEARKVKIWDILKLKKEEEVLFLKWMNNIFKGSIHFKDLLHFAPKRFKENEFVELQFRPIYKSDRVKLVEKVICIGSDKTKERNLEEKMEKDRQKVQFFSNCLRRPVEFIDLIDDSFSFFKNWTTIHKNNTEEIFRTFHTLKARFSQFGLKKITSIIHDIETYISEEEFTKVDERVEELKTELESFLKENRLIVEAANKFLIDEGHAITIPLLRKKLKEAKNIEDFEDYINKNFVLRDLKLKFKKFSSLVQEISETQDKKIRFDLLGPEIMVDSEQYENFINISVHLIRNMVDHGIETKEERLRNNKSPEGLIKIHFIPKEKSFQIIFEDDGQGINIQTIKNKIFEKRLATEKELNQFSEKEIFSFLFTPGFSTKTQVTELSGRGIGLDSVKSEIDSLGGGIEIETKPGKGSKFVIELPLFK